MSQNIYLIGMRGVGKTTVGKALAKKLSRNFVDMDEDLVRKEGMTVHDLVQAGGWDLFRQKEKECVGRMLRKKESVIATGGGTLMYFDNADRLKNSGRIIFLRAMPQTLAKWLKGQKERPSLTGKGVAEELEEVWSQRKSTYEKYADITADMEQFSSPDALINFLLVQLRNS
ncbi:MAG: shikimate kinase [bacterium]|nr:shikimate kinase [bacterium]